MAEQIKKEVIIDVKVERDKRIEELLNLMGSVTKEIVECDVEISKLKKTVKENGVITQEQAKELARLTSERKTAVKQLQSLSREEQNLVVANSAAKNSLNALRAELNALKVQIGDIDIDSAAFAEMAQRIETINQKVSKAEQSYGVFSRNVGNYKSGFSGLSFQIQQIARELPSLSIGLPQFFLALSNNIPMLTDEITRARGEIKAAKEAGKEFVPLNKQIIGSIFSVQTAIVAVVTILSVWGDDILKWAGKVLKGKDALDNFRKSTSAMVGSVAQERAELGALFYALAQAEEGTANYLAVRNTILDKYGDLLENEREEVRNLNNIAEAYDLISRKITGKAIVEGFNKQIEEQSKTFADTYKDYFDKLLPEFIEAFGEEGVSKLSTFIDALGNGGINDRTATAILAELNKSGAERKTGRYLFDIVDLYTQNSKTIEQLLKAQEELAKAYNAEVGDDNGRGSGDDAFQKAQRALELEQQIAKERLALERATAYNTEQIYSASEEEKFAFEQKWNRKEFDLEQSHQQAMLDLQLQYGDISQEEYDKQNTILRSQRDKYNQEELTQQREQSIKLREQLLKDAENLKKDIAKVNEDVEQSNNKTKWENYRQEVQRLLSEGVIDSFTANLLTSYANESETNDANTISRRYRQAERRNEQEGGRTIKEDIEEFYADDVRQFSDSESERLRYAIEVQEAIIAERRKAGLETYEQEADLAHLQKDLQTSLYQDELALAWKSADQQYEITKRYLEEQLKLYEGNEAEQARIQQEIADNEANRLRERLERFEEYSSAVGNLMSATNDLAQALYNRQLETEKANNEMAQNDLEKRYNAGLIRQAEYNRQKEVLDKQLAQKEAILQRKQAIYERALAIFNLGIDTASGIMNIWATHGAFPARAIALTALLSATSALQLSTILAEPLPKARKGGRIEGATHEAGGVLVETERDERIVSSNVAKTFPELLNLMSYIGKHARIPYTGYAERHSRNALSESELIANEVAKQINIALRNDSTRQAQVLSQEVAKSIGKEMRKVKIYTAITDVRKADKKYSDIVASAEM